MYSELIANLETILSDLKTRQNFPFMQCDDTAHTLSCRLGFYWVKGKYLGNLDPEYVERAKKVWDRVDPLNGVEHSFSYDPKRKLIIDLTARQFDHTQPDIIVMPLNDRRIALPYFTRTSETTHRIGKLYNYVLHGEKAFSMLPSGKLELRLCSKTE